MAEIRYFLKQIENAASHAVKISDTVWEKAADKLFKTYAGSSCLEICRNLLRDFETVNPDKYYNDLLEFIKESSYEDFMMTKQKLCMYLLSIKPKAESLILFT